MPDISPTPWIDQQLVPQVFYFGDELPTNLTNVLLRLRGNSKSSEHRQLSWFLAECTRIIRDELSDLPAADKKLAPPFENILDLGRDELLFQGRLGLGLEYTLLCVIEIAALIGYFEINPSKFRLHSHEDSTLALGMGMGLLAAAALSSSLAISDLAIVGAEIVRVAFRTGYLVTQISGVVEQSGDLGPRAWSRAYLNIDETAALAELDHLNRRKAIPTLSKVYLSAANTDSVIISGPPTWLKAVSRHSDFFRNHDYVELPTHAGLYHAAHVYSTSHIAEIVRTKGMIELNRTASPQVPVLSPSSGKPIHAVDTLTLVEGVVEEFLRKPVRFDRTIQFASDWLQLSGTLECRISSFGHSYPLDSLKASITGDDQDFEMWSQDIFDWTIKHEPTRPKDHKQSKLAIVGMACRLPGGVVDSESFWSLLENGLDVHRTIPPDRFDLDSHFDPSGKTTNASLTPYGCFIDDPGYFDAAFFNMSPREALETDPMHRLALVTAYEALEGGGIVSNRTPSTDLRRIGVFYGQSCDDYREVNAGQEVGTYYIPGGCRAFAPGRINYFFKFSGPSFSIDTACSSSLANIQQACTALWSGDADTIVAGGLNILTNCDGFAGLSRGHFLSKTGNCKTWDADADGYCRADAIGSVVIKRLDDAEADNDNILGVILASATNHSADAISITHPHAGAQAYLYDKCLARAGVKATDVDFVEMHGTGTQAGDGIEITSITDVFAPLASDKRRTDEQPLYIGAVKSNVGHSEAGAGVTALIKVLTMLRKDAIPPHVGIKNKINPFFATLDLDKRNVRIPFEQRPWARSDRKRIAVVNNFSAAGGNTTLVLEEAPIKTVEGVDPRSKHVVTISAKSKASLKGNLSRFLGYLGANQDMSLANLAYTSTARRNHYNHRVSVSVSQVSEIVALLRPHIEMAETHKSLPSKVPHIAFIFTGQGSFYKQLGGQLYEHFPSFRKDIDRFDYLAQAHSLPSILPAIMDDSTLDSEISPSVTQLTLVCIGMALANFWKSIGIQPNVVVGASLGEFAALYVAGVLSASDAIFLTGKRAELLEKMCQPGSNKMIAIRGSVNEVVEILGNTPYEVACINSPRETVISAKREVVDDITSKYAALNIRITVLDVPFAFHSCQVDPILKDFRNLCESVTFKMPILPIISPLLKKVIFDDQTINGEYLVRATRETVDLVGAFSVAWEASIVDESTAWIEMGPHPVCCNFVKNCLPETKVVVPSLRKGHIPWSTLSDSLAILHDAGLAIDWATIHQPFERALTLVDMPTYSWNETNYWLQYEGDWNLVKNKYADALTARTSGPVQAPVSTSLRTTLIHGLVQEDYTSENTAVLVAQTDILHPEFLKVVMGHRMNNNGVVTLVIHSDIAFTLGKYIYGKLRPSEKFEDVAMDFGNVKVLEPLILKKDSTEPQLIHIVADADLSRNCINLTWHHASNTGDRGNAFVSGEIEFGTVKNWKTNFARTEHLLLSRVKELHSLANTGAVNRLTKSLVYKMFENLSEYSEEYQGMQQVVLNGGEAVAEVTLGPEPAGIYTVSPTYLDCVAHVGTFVMNCGDFINASKYFAVTPGWKQMVLLKPLVPGGKYTSYVHMAPLEDASYYSGDVYIMQDKKIIGLVGGFTFRRYPRAFMERIFVAPDANHKPEISKVRHNFTAITATAENPQQKLLPTLPPPPSKPAAVASKAPIIPSPASSSTPSSEPAFTPTASASTSSSVIAPAKAPTDAPTDGMSTKVLTIVAKEAQIPIGQFTPDASFADLGIDSLLSLVIAEKITEGLGIDVPGSLFLEYPTVGELSAWLQEYC